MENEWDTVEGKTREQKETRKHMVGAGPLSNPGKPDSTSNCNRGKRERR